MLGFSNSDIEYSAQSAADSEDLTIILWLIMVDLHLTVGIHGHR
jgi:hypothetical protein